MSWSLKIWLTWTASTMVSLFPEKKHVMKTTFFHIHINSDPTVASNGLTWGMNLVEESEYWLLENLWKAMRGTSPPVPLVIAEKDYKAHSSGNSVVEGEHHFREFVTIVEFEDVKTEIYIQRAQSVKISTKELILDHKKQWHHILDIKKTDTCVWCGMVKCYITFVCFFWGKQADWLLCYS